MLCTQKPLRAACVRGRKELLGITGKSSKCNLFRACVLYTSQVGVGKRVCTKGEGQLRSTIAPMLHTNRYMDIINKSAIKMRWAEDFAPKLCHIRSDFMKNVMHQEKAKVTNWEPQKSLSLPPLISNFSQLVTFGSTGRRG